MAPGLNLTNLNTLEAECQCAPNPQPEYVHRQVSHDNHNPETSSTNIPSPARSEHDPALHNWRSHERDDTESRRSVQADTMEVETPRPIPRIVGKDSNELAATSHRSDTSAPVSEGEKFERILDAVEEAGFDSIDTMAAQYYSTEFPPDSSSQLAQAISRSRDLRRLLQTLQKTAKTWSPQETQAYQEEIVRSAGSICLDELRMFRERQADRLQGASAASSGSIPRSSSSNSSSIAGSGADTMDQLRQLLLKEESKQPTQQEKRLLRQCLPETWSLLSGLARGSDLPPAQVSQVVYSFLHMTTTKTII